MSKQHGLGRRTFLQNAGMTALLGAVSGGAPSVAAAAVVGAAAQGMGGKYDFDTPYNRFGTNSVKYDQQIRTFGKDSVQVGMGIADIDFRPRRRSPRRSRPGSSTRTGAIWTCPTVVRRGNHRLEQEALRRDHRAVAAGHRRRGAPGHHRHAQGVLAQGHQGAAADADLQRLLRRPHGASQTLAEEVPLKFANGTLRDGLRAVREADQRRHQLLHPLQPAEPDRQLLERRRPDPDRRDLPEAPRGRPGRRDPLRLRGERARSTRRSPACPTRPSSTTASPSRRRASRSAWPRTRRRGSIRPTPTT